MNSSAITIPSHRLQKNQGTPYLKVQFGGQRIFAALPMGFVQEVLVLPVRQLTPMPNKPSCLLGLTNRRSRVLWVVDLAHLLGLGRLPANVQQHSVVITQIGSLPLGLALQQVDGITWIPPQDVQAVPSNLAPGLLPYLVGCCVQSQELLMLLDVMAIARSPVLHAE
ncbi:MAG: chemotaxis protein CheW [Cyanobacteria bacterium J069]|nr:MAG: purine-binding chemotaxis protein CheW [Cyanobacteria bacterium J069]